MTKLPFALLLVLAPFLYGGGKDDDHDDGDDDDDKGAKANLFLPSPAPDPDANGKVILSQDCEEQNFRVFCKKLPSSSPPGPFEVWLEGSTSGSFSKVGTMTQKSKPQ